MELAMLKPRETRTRKCIFDLVFIMTFYRVNGVVKAKEKKGAGVAGAKVDATMNEKKTRVYSSRSGSKTEAKA